MAWMTIAGSSNVRFQNKGELLLGKRAVKSREDSGFSRDRHSFVVVSSGFRLPLGSVVN